MKEQSFIGRCSIKVKWSIQQLGVFVETRRVGLSWYYWKHLEVSDGMEAVVVVESLSVYNPSHCSENAAFNSFMDIS
jgi:hypothetical protein